MPQQQWADVDRYIFGTLLAPDPALKSALAANEQAGLPAIDVAPNQGKLLHLLALLRRPSRILEIGTLGGYSTIWLARALPADGLLVTLEVNANHAAVARTNIANAGLSKLVEVRLGPAAESLAQLHSEGAGPFQMIFIDADKPANPVYLEWALKLSAPGTLIVFDNVVRDGELANNQSQDPKVLGTRAMFQILAGRPGITATAIQTVGIKGYDGFLVALIRPENSDEFPVRGPAETYP